MRETITALLVEDNLSDARLMREALRDAEGSYIELVHVDTLAKALAHLDEERFDVIMLDLTLPDADGLTTLLRVHNHAPGVPIVVLTGLDDEAVAVSAVRHGAQDYLVKGQVTGQLLVRAMRYATERKHAIEALQKSNETLRAVIETSPLAIYALDLEGKVKSWNSAAERIFGYTERQVLDKRLRIVAAEDEQAFLRRLADAAAGKLLVGHEERRYKSHGEPIEVSIWNAQLRNATGAVTGIVEAVADNSERKRLEEQFRQAQKMEAVGRLAGGIAHDFNNLLTVIAGYCQMLLNRIPPDDPMSEDMLQVLKAADRATVLTKQLLAFSRRQVFQPKVIDLRTLLADMDHMLKRLVGEKIVLTTRADDDLGLVQVDPGHLQQVIVNLVVNARDAMPNGGTVTIVLKNADVSADFSHKHISLPEGKYILLEVNDTGLGITPETMAHLFEPFFTTKEKGRGTGLGLSTSYGIVKQNHGEILVRSAPGAGSTFSIYLPRATSETADPQEPTRSAAPPYRGGSETVLVAEDEDGVRTVITDMLRTQGYSVMTARGGAEALEVARTLPKVDLLISDVIMPGMNGPELARKLRAMRPDVRVLYVSGYPDKAIEQKSVLDPATSFLNKPFTPDGLAMKVREVLDRVLEPARPSAAKTRRIPKVLRDEQSF